MWNTVVWKKRWAGVALLSLFSGCTALSDCKYELGQKIRTGQAWHEYDGCHEDCFTLDYRSGWKAGYYDVITGGSGCPPLIAPKKYWKPPVFTEHDSSKRNDWYSGFQDGAACAKCQPDHHFLEVWSPPTYCPVDSVSFTSTADIPTQFPMMELNEVPHEVPVAPTEGQDDSSHQESPPALPEDVNTNPSTATERSPSLPPEKSSPKVDEEVKKDYEADPGVIPPDQSQNVVPEKFPLDLILTRSKVQEDESNRTVLKELVWNLGLTQASAEQLNRPVSVAGN